MTTKEVKEYRAFMANPDNVRECDGCPANEDKENQVLRILPCGQYHCWVELTAEREAK